MHLFINVLSRELQLFSHGEEDGAQQRAAEDDGRLVAGQAVAERGHMAVTQPPDHTVTLNKSLPCFNNEDEQTIPECRKFFTILGCLTITPLVIIKPMALNSSLELI